MRFASRRRRRAALVLALGTYMVLIGTNPLLHHDLSCHLKSPTHCQACTSNPSASKVEHRISLDVVRLADSGSIHAPAETLPKLAVAVPTAGRSPPA
jgi:hypothetical protein